MFWEFGNLNIFQSNIFNCLSRCLQRRVSRYDLVNVFAEKTSLFRNYNEFNNVI